MVNVVEGAFSTCDELFADFDLWNSIFALQRYALYSKMSAG